MWSYMGFFKLNFNVFNMKSYRIREDSRTCNPADSVILRINHLITYCFTDIEVVRMGTVV